MDMTSAWARPGHAMLIESVRYRIDQFPSGRKTVPRAHSVTLFSRVVFSPITASWRSPRQVLFGNRVVLPTPSTEEQHTIPPRQ